MNACHVIGICCCQAMIAGSLLLSGCGPSSAEQERLAKLANVKKVALVGFVGKSSVSPGAVTYKGFTDKTFAAFQRAASSAPPVVELIPVRNVVENDSYKAVSKIKMPDGAYSPIGGLTYISQGAEKGFDCGPLVQALGVDALLIVVIDFGIAIRNHGSDFFLVGKVESHLVAPPEESLWKAPSPFEEQILISIVDHPKLIGSIGAKWVVMARPSAEEYAELMQIAEERKTKVPQEIGTSLVSSLVREIKKAREYARSSAPNRARRAQSQVRPPNRFQPIREDGPPSNDRRVSCLAPPLRSSTKQLGAASPSRAYVVQPEPAWCLRYAPAPNWHLRVAERLVKARYSG